MIRRILNKIESIYQHRYFSKVDSGAYNFLLKKVYKSTDIEFLEQIWQLDYFREILQPVPLKVEKLKKVLVLAPHQDDEIIGCGGTMLKLRELGSVIDVVYLTDGAELSNPINSIITRDQEASEVCNKLNAKKYNLGIDNINLGLPPGKIDELVQILNKKWDLIFTVWPLDNPPKHRLCSYIVGKALKLSQYKGQVAFYAVHTNLLPNSYHDISDTINKKHQLLEVYKSQLKFQNYTHISKGLDAWNSKLLEVSPKERFIEVFMKIPAVKYQEFQDIYEKVNAKKLFKSHDACIKTFNDLQKK